jgi:hypothetical protein
MSLVPGVTGTLKPVVNPELIVPIPIIPVNEGDKVTIAPGTAVKVLFGVLDWKSCAVIVTVDPTSDAAAVVL